MKMMKMTGSCCEAAFYSPPFKRFTGLFAVIVSAAKCRCSAFPYFLLGHDGKYADAEFGATHFARTDPPTYETWKKDLSLGQIVNCSCLLGLLLTLEESFSYGARLYWSFA